MSLLQHTMNLIGATQGTFDPQEIKSGHTITLIEWHGCMATGRREVDTGDIERVAPSPYDNGKYQGLEVRWDKVGLRWEPLSEVRHTSRGWELWR